MKKLTKLEREVMERMFAGHLRDHSLVPKLLESLVIERRTFSEDALNKNLCCGFYLDLENIGLLAEIINLPPRLNIQGQHPRLPLGADFILFFNLKQGKCFLEATFYGYSIPIDDVVSDESNFSFPAQMTS